MNEEQLLNNTFSWIPWYRGISSLSFCWNLNQITLIRLAKKRIPYLLTQLFLMVLNCLDNSFSLIFLVLVLEKCKCLDLCSSPPYVFPHFMQLLLAICRLSVAIISWALWNPYIKGWHVLLFRCVWEKKEWEENYTYFLAWSRKFRTFKDSVGFSSHPKMGASRVQLGFVWNQAFSHFLHVFGLLQSQETNEIGLYNTELRFQSTFLPGKKS